MGILIQLIWNMSIALSIVRIGPIKRTISQYLILVELSSQLCLGLFLALSFANGPLPLQIINFIPVFSDVLFDLFPNRMTSNQIHLCLSLKKHIVLSLIKCLLIIRLFNPCSLYLRLQILIRTTYLQSRFNPRTI